MLTNMKYIVINYSITLPLRRLLTEVISIWFGNPILAKTIRIKILTKGVMVNPKNVGSVSASGSSAVAAVVSSAA